MGELRTHAQAAVSWRQSVVSGRKRAYGVVAVTTLGSPTAIRDSAATPERAWKSPGRGNRHLASGIRQPAVPRSSRASTRARIGSRNGRVSFKGSGTTPSRREGVGAAARMSRF